MGLVKDSFSTFLTQGILIVVALACGVIVARFLGPEGKGIYLLVFLPINLIVSVVPCGIPVAQIYFIGKQKYKREDILANALTIGTGVSIGGIALFICIFNFIHPLFFKDVPVYLFYIALITIPTGVMILYLRYFLMAVNRVREFNAVHLIWRIVIFIFIVVFIVIFRFGVTGAVLSVCIGEIVSLLAALVLVKKYSKIRPGCNSVIIKDLLKYGAKSQCGQVLDMISMRLDVWMIAYFLGPVAVGYYSVALISQQLLTIPDSVGINLFRKLSNSSFEDSRTASKIVMRNLLFMVLLVVCAFFVFGRWVILLLYGKVFLPAVVPFLILLPSVLLFTISKNLKPFLSGHGRPELASYASVFSFGVNVCLNYFLIPRWGINGAAVASSISVFIYAMIILYFYLKISGNSVFETLFVRISDIELYRNLIVGGKSL